MAIGKGKFPGEPFATRQATITQTRAAEGEAPALYEVAVSSETEVVRSDWWGAFREVLGHKRTEIDMSRFKSGRAAVLEEHGGPPVGVIEDARIDSDHVLRATIRFSRSARGQEIEQDVRDGIRGNVSVGYIRRGATLIEENEERGNLWRVDDWEPVELSIVGVPMDKTVGVGRAYEIPREVGVKQHSQEDRAMERKKVRGEGGTIIDVPMDDPRPAVSEREVTLEAKQTRDAKLIALGETFNVPLSEIRRWLQSDMSVEAAQGELLAQRTTAAVMQPSANPLANAPKDQSYSFCRAILGAVARQSGQKWTGYEADVDAELGKVFPRNRGGIFIPLTMGLQRRALESQGPGKGAELVYEAQGEFIELLRNRIAAVRLGGRVLPNLTAPISFPKQTAAVAAKWIGENPAAPVAKSDPTLAALLLSQKTLMAQTDVSHQLLVSGSLDAEALIRNDMASQHKIAIDLAVFHGLGAAGEPLGIYYVPGTNVTAVGGATSYAKVLEAQGKVASKNADEGALGWVTNPTIATNLQGLPRFTNSDTPIWTGTYANGFLGGYNAIATNQISKTMSGSDATGGSEIGAIFGNWNDVLIGLWGAMEVIVDPYTKAGSALYVLTSYQGADVGIRHAESFTKFTGATG